MRRRFFVAVLLAVSALGGVAAQEQAADPNAKQPQAAAPAPRRLEVPLRVQIVLSRLQGDKKLSSLPFVLGVVSNSMKTNVRMGVEVPIGFGASYSYRSVGTNIDCGAETLSDALYRLIITVDDSSIQLNAGPGSSAGQSPVTKDVPSFRSFKASFAVLLRDGQSTQYTSATDPVSGEVMKIDVGLNVMK